MEAMVVAFNKDRVAAITLVPGTSRYFSYGVKVNLL
jgi:hypothetical protein